MSLSDIDWKTVLAAIPAGLLLIAGFNAWLAARTERRRNQPVVIHHAWQKMKLDGGQWSAGGYLTNDGGGAAFNVRCGLIVRRCRVPHRGIAGDGPPTRHRVLAPDQRHPAPDEHPPIGGYYFATRVPTLVMRGGPPGVDEKRLFWCRYENAYGQTWETRNPEDPVRNMRIRRIYCPRIRERWDLLRLRLTLRLRGRRFARRVGLD